MDTTKKHIHVIGIGGSGASAIAAIAQAQGFTVTGCDRVIHNEFTSVFSENQLLEGHSPDHLKDVDMIAVTPAVFSFDPENPELKAAKEQGIPILTWQQFMGEYLEKDKFVIAICGTHGKSTTTAMIGELLEDAGFDPTVELGAIVPKWQANYRIGKGKFFITEADEFNDNFLASKPNIAVVTSVEMDHPEYFKDFFAYKASFDQFLSQTKDTIVANMSDENVGDVIKYVMKQSGTTVVDYSKSDFNLQLQIPGSHNVMNAQAAFQVGLLLGLDPEVIRKSINNFTGIGRRQELIGEINGAKVYSDFGHHPTEIKVTLEAFREKYPHNPITVIFQPHMFSRTKTLFDEFVSEFQSVPVDTVYILDIYPSREIDMGIVSSKQLVDAVKKSSVIYEPNADELLKKLKSQPKKGEIYLFLGAGDTDKLARKLIEVN